MSVFVFGFVLGVSSILIAEAICVIYLFNRLLLQSSSSSSKQKQSDQQLDHQQESLAFASSKQGILWALEPDKLPKTKTDISEVLPVKKRAKIIDHSLILTDVDAASSSSSSSSQATIPLLGCTVLAVSASNLPSRKWAKRYPIKLESKFSIYKGTTTLHLYFETSWDKESWCKALRLASCLNKDRLNWYATLTKDFHHYISSLKQGYPSFMKPSSSSSTALLSDSSPNFIRTDSSSKVRLFLKKIANRASKPASQNNKPPALSDSNRKTTHNSLSPQDLTSSGSTKIIATENTPNNHLASDKIVQTSQSSTMQSASQDPLISLANSDDNFSIDEGTLCWNLLISRLFFDAKRNTDMKNSIQARIQRTLSSMRTPSYIGGVTCTSLDVGTLPPYIRSVRVIPTDMNEVWAMEVDIEYSGGAILDVETRLEVQEAEFEKRIVDASVDPNSVDEVTSDLLEGFEHFGKQLKPLGDMVEETEKRYEEDSQFDGMKKGNNRKSNYRSRWKCILNSIANQVSQVPISLAIKVASVRGTLRLHIKPPPSDQLWLGFTSMPEIDFNLESSVGDHKISNTHVALLLENRFKAAIRDTLVLPNCEGVYIPWMLAEKDDWAPRKAAPFIRINQEAPVDPMISEASSSQSGEVKTVNEAGKVIIQGTDNHLEEKREKPTNQASVPQSTREPAEDLRSLSRHGSTSSRSNGLSTDSRSLPDVKTPLLLNSEPDEISNGSRSESPDRQSISRSVSVGEKEVPVGEDANPKRIGRKARMMDLGKKMGEKLEEKRRNIEEKSRTIVEKIRGHDVIGSNKEGSAHHLG